MPIEIPDPPRIPDPDTVRPQSPPSPEQAAEPRELRAAVRNVPLERWYGVYCALVSDNVDPDGIGRVQVVFPWAPDVGGSAGIQKGQRYEVWARVATLAAGRNRGSWFLPDVGDEVLVSFEAGHPSRPVVVGALWNGVDTPPVAAAAGNHSKVLRTRSGSEIRFNDEAGHETVEIRTAAGQSVLLTSEDGGSARVADGHHSSVTLTPAGITLQSASSVAIKASAITLEAAAINLDSALVKCVGVLQSDSLITNTVVAASYTPGAGNVW
jgi:uncharacterized protein involved in type VI secretion and phage assembly